MITRKSTSTLLLVLAAVIGASAASMQAQVAPSAIKSPISLTVGGTVSVFDPDYIQNKLVGAGAFIDVNLFHGIGVEAEGRWQRFHEFEGISQDNYLIGPRVQVLHFWRLRPYAKVLGGFSNMNFEDGIGTGRFTTLAFGGGVDIKMTRRLSVRAFDAEYQYWPTFLGGSLSPFGASAGISYRVF
jgi:Outer membrane protein beta-barrel domain